MTAKFVRKMTNNKLYCTFSLKMLTNVNNITLREFTTLSKSEASKLMLPILMKIAPSILLCRVILIT
jgi:hypothetical protein